MNRCDKSGIHARKPLRSAVSLAVCGILTASLPVTAGTRATDLRCEYRRNPLAIDVRVPRLSWTLEADPDARGVVQSAYRILVAGSPETLAAGKGDLWDSGKVDTDRQVHVEYAGQPLTSQQRCYWKVQVWAGNGQASPWSEPATWTMGLLKPGDWKGSWLSFMPCPPIDERPRKDWYLSDRDNATMSQPWFRKTVTLPAQPARALAYVASFGYHELQVNGRKVSDTFFDPAVSEMNKRLPYRTYDVAPFLKKGKNTIGLWISHGWFRRQMAGVFHDSPVVLAQVDIAYPDGRTQTIATDPSWKTKASPSRLTAFHVGRGIVGHEVYMADEEIANWSSPELDDRDWAAPHVVEVPSTVALSAQRVQPNRQVGDVIRAAAVKELEPGVYEIDMGRTYVGLFELDMHGAGKGDRIQMDFYEQEVGTDNMISYGQRDTYVARGGRGERFRNHVDYRSFRYVVVRGLKQAPQPADARGMMISTDAPKAGAFTCSNELLNKIYETVDWTYLACSLGGNIVDCPHRERLGYGAEGQASMLTAMTGYEKAPFFTHWLEVWRDLQNPETGMMYHTAPSCDRSEGSPGWGGICVTLPWELYLRYGDTRILEESYDSIRGWIGFLESKSENDLLPHYGPGTWGFFADWVAPGRNIKGRFRNAVPKDSEIYFNNAYTILNVQTAAKIARLLGETQDAEAWEAQAARRRKAVHERYYDGSRRVYAIGEQGYQAMALLADIVKDEGQRNYLHDHLTYLVTESRKGHLNTGVLGTFFMLRYLLETDRSDLVYDMATQWTYPGWGWFIDRGATTIPEHWGGIYSQIHTSFLSLNSWCIEGLGGIRLDEEAPGYKRIMIKPAVVGDLEWVKAAYRGPYGPIATHWQRRDGKLRLEVTIPPNTTAAIHIPTTDPDSVTESGRPAKEAPGVTWRRVDEGTWPPPIPSADKGSLGQPPPRWAVVEVGSGRYTFTAAEPMNAWRSRARIPPGQKP